VALVTLDLDGTLLASTVFRNVGRQLGHADYIDYVDELYEQGTIGLRAAFYAEYPLFLNEPIERVHAALAEADWVADIAATVDELEARGHEVWYLTDQPDWATAYLERFGIEDGVDTRTTRWEGDRVGAAVDIAFEKLPALVDRLSAEKHAIEDIVHVGNGTNDVPVFEAVDGAVAFNPSAPAVGQAAAATVRSDSLAGIVEAIG
jgi:phosphoserine phosphatase